MIAAMRIGPYEVVSTLGQGGMGVVYGARSPDGRDVAIKILHKNEGEVLARFERERRLLASLGEAEGFVPLLDTGATENGPYLVMPLVPGGTLREKLEAGPLGIDETVELGRRLAFALGEAHARGIVHRDMKPENILFTAEGLPLAADLGLAKHFDDRQPGASQSVSLSREGTFRGTAGYMAPEHMADAKSAAPAADVFALGVILYECLAGEPPFLGDGAVELLTKVAEGRFEPLRKRRTDVPRWLAATVECALAPAARDRFPDGLALGRALAAGGAGASRGSRRFRPAVLVGASVAVLAGSLALAYAIMPRAGPDAPRVVARTPKPTPSSQAEGAVDARGRLEQELGSGNERLARHDWEGAIESFTKAIELDPKSAAWLKRGVAKGGKGDWDGAIADLTRAIELDPEHAQPWETRGAAKSQNGDNDGAITDLTRAIELDPEHAMAWGDRGSAKLNKGDCDGAIPDLTRAIELDPKLAVAWCNRGLARGQRGDYDGTIADCTRAVELDPQAAGAWGNRGSAKSGKGDYDGAITDFTRVIELNPQAASAWYNRGSAKSKKGDHDGAIADCTRAIELNPKHARAWCDRGVAKGRTGDLDGAIADLERFLELAPKEQNTASTREALERLRGLRDKR
jgi:serine/threonine protein kinase